MSTFIDWRRLVDGLTGLVQSPAMRSRERVLLSAVLLDNRGADINQEAISALSGLSRSTVFRQLGKLVELGALEHHEAAYTVTGGGQSAYHGGWLKQGDSSPETRDSGPVPKPGTEPGTDESRNPGPNPGLLQPANSPETRDSDCFKRDLLTSKPDQVDEKSREANAPLAGWLAGSADPSSTSSPTPSEGIPVEGDGVGRPAEGHAPDEAPPPGWFVQLCELIASKMPRRRGRHGVFLSPLTPDLEGRISRVIIENGGWRRFDAQIRPLLVDFDQEIKSPHRLLATFYKQVDSGTARRRPIGRDGRVPSFVGEGYVERFGDERAATLYCARSLALREPSEPHFDKAVAWLASRAAEADVAEFITGHFWVFATHHREALATAHRTLEGRQSA